MQTTAFGIRNPVGGFLPERLIFGRSAAMQEIREIVGRVADVSVPVLLQGEKGTGKELIAREIHRRSRCYDGPFVIVASKELSAAASRKSRNGEGVALPWRRSSVVADGPEGTLFFDEVSELNPTLQATLLGLFRNEVSRSGGETNGHVGSRIICATQRDLESEVAAGNFRSDLFYRINIVTIQIPGLRDRKEDIPELVEYFFEAHCRKQSRLCRSLPTDVLQLFCEYQWPGNIRELESCIRRYVSTNGEFGAGRRTSRPGPSKRAELAAADGMDAIPLKTYKRQVVEQAEKDMILKVLRQQRWNRKQTARVLQISYNTLLQKLKQIEHDEKAGARAGHSPKQVVMARTP
jgi:DNA-binding NtrC family response regulator